MGMISIVIVLQLLYYLDQCCTIPFVIHFPLFQYTLSYCHISIKFFIIFFFFSCYQAFDVFTRQLFATCPYSIIFPCSIFDCTVDHDTYELVRWKCNGNDLPRAFPAQNFFPTDEVS